MVTRNYITTVINLTPTKRFYHTYLILKNKRRIMRSSCCLSVYLSVSVLVSFHNFCKQTYEITLLCLPPPNFCYQAYEITLLFGCLCPPLIICRFLYGPCRVKKAYDIALLSVCICATPCFHFLCGPCHSKEKQAILPRTYCFYIERGIMYAFAYLSDL